MPWWKKPREAWACVLSSSRILMYQPSLGSLLTVSFSPERSLSHRSPILQFSSLIVRRRTWLLLESMSFDTPLQEQRRRRRATARGEAHSRRGKGDACGGEMGTS
jgi:hypothetical protein